MARTLETILTARNLLSPVLATAGRDVERFDRQVSDAHNRAGNSSTESARRQREASNTIIDSQGRIITSSDRVRQSGDRTGDSIVTSGTRQVRTHREIAEQATVSSRTQEAANRALMSSNSLLGASLSPLTAGFGLVAAGIGYAAYRGAEFDAAMSQVQAASQASAGEMNKLRDAAIEQGAKTKYSGEEAAQGITEMAKAGVSTTDILNGGLVGALNLAAAGQIDVAEAAETGATALSVFKLEGSQMSHVADLMAAGAGKAQGSVGDLSAALNQSALLAAQTGLSIEDTTGALAMFASNGLLGSDAGTSFKTMLQALTPNSNAAAKAMDAIGFSAYDAQGKFVGMESVAGQLQTGLAGLSEEQRNATLETIFGSDAVRAASVLYTEGAAGVTEWTGKVNDAGYAQKQASQLSDNLKGDLERLGGAFDAAMTSLGGSAQDPLRDIVQFLTSAVETGADVISFFTNLPGAAQLAIGAFAGWLAVGDKITEKFSALSGSGDGIFSTFVSSVSTAVTESDGFRDSISNISSAGGDAARTGLKSLAKAIGPELGLAAATYLAGKFIESIVDVSNLGKTAHENIADLGESIKSAEGNGERFEVVKTGLDDLRKKAADAQTVFDDFDNQNWFDKYVWENPFGNTNDEQDAKASVESYQAQIKELEDATQRANGTVEALANRYKVSREDVISFADAHGIDLTGAVDKTQWAFTRLASATGEFTPQLAAVASGMDISYTSLEAYAAGLGMDKDATEELRKKSDELGQTLGDFVNPLGAYTGLLAEKKQAEQDAAQDTAAATESTTDSWEDYATDVGVTFDEYMARLEEQVTAQDNWKLNMLRLAGEVSEGTLAELSRMGPEGAPLVADLVTRSDAELDKFDDITQRRSKEATDAWGEQLTLATPVLAAIGKTAGQGVVDELAAKLQAGTTTVADIAKQYGVNLAGGINPVLTALGKPKITYTGEAIVANGRTAGYAEGGYTGDGGKYEPKGVVHGGEYVFTKEETAKAGPSNLAMLAKSLRGYASGGLVELGRRLQGMGASVTEHPAFGGVAMGGHGKTSLHYTGHALDVNTRPGTSPQEQQELTPMMQLARQLGFRTIFMAPDHYNHLHVDDGGGASMGSGGLAAAVTLAKPPSTAPFGSPISTVADAAMQRVYDDASAFVTANTFVSPEGEGGGSAGAGVEQWRNTVNMALARTGLPLTDAAVTLRRMQQESGGNPRAINNWDVNATRGTPSKGLMQVIDPTFAANRDKGLVNDIWDPLANIVASMNYAVGRYGSLPAAYGRAGGYDSGGVANGIGLLPKYTVEPERVLSPRQTAAFEQWMTSPASQPGYGMGGGMGPGGSAPVTVTVDNHFYVDGQELKGMAQSEAVSVLTSFDQARRIQNRLAGGAG